MRFIPPGARPTWRARATSRWWRFSIRIWRRCSGRRFGAGVERAITRYVRAVYAQFDLVLAPSRADVRLPRTARASRAARYQPLGVDTEVFSPARRTLDLRRLLELPDDDAPAGVCRPLLPGKEPARCCAQRSRSLGKPYHLLLIGGGRAARLSHNVSVLPYRRDSVELAQCAGFSRRPGARRQQRNLRPGDHRSHGLRPAGGRRARRGGAGADR